MKTYQLFAILLTVLAVSIFSAHAWGDTFGSGAFSIEFVTIGNPGNPADTSVAIPGPAGSVATVYRIGKYETSEQMIDTANTLGGLGITKDTRGVDKPATSISWNEAARFVNWLNTSSGSTPAYKFDFQPGQGGYNSNANIQLWTPSDPGYNPNNLYRNSLARYFLPSVDEWHKAAYYNPNGGGVYFDYPTGSDSVPDGIDVPGDPIFDAVFNDNNPNLLPNDITNVGVLSPYGTAGQGGNVYEWNETDADAGPVVNGPSSDPRILRGGYWQGGFGNLHATVASGVTPALESNQFGFRVASGTVPELPNAGDVNLDGQVNQLDLNIVNGNWLASGTDRAHGDLNGDGQVNQLDLNLVNGNWLGTGGTGSFATVPEPSTLALLTLGGVGLIARRRSRIS